MCKVVALCGEGPTDYGKPEFGTENWIEGPLHDLIRNCCATGLDIRCIDRQEVLNIRLQRTKAKGHGAKAHKLGICALKRGIKHAICYVDADRECTSKNTYVRCKKRFDDIYAQIADGFQQIGAEFLGIPMVPLKMIECWLLSDEHAFEKVFGDKPAKPRLPSHPELIWGKEDNPESDYPKNYLTRVISQYPKGDRIENVHKQLAENTEVEVLKSKCPISFGKFSEDIKKLE